MEERIKNVMATVFDVPEQKIHRNSSPDNLENWDSLRHMNLILALEEEFDIEFDEIQIGEMMNFELVELTVKELLEKA